LRQIPNLTPRTFDAVTTQRLRSMTPGIIDLSVSFGLYFSTYSLGWINGNYKGHHFFAHNGGTLGHSTFFINFPNDAITIGFGTNQLGLSIVPEILHSCYIFDLLLGQDSIISEDNICLYAEVSTLSSDSYKQLTSNVTSRDQYIGVYTNSIYGDVTIFPEQNTDNLFFELGMSKGKLRSQNRNSFAWFTETNIQASRYSITFTTSGNKASSFVTTLGTFTRSADYVLGEKI